MRVPTALLLCCATSIVFGGAADLTALERAMRAGNPRLVQTLTGHTGPVRSVAVSVDGRRMASVGDDGTLRLWNALTGACIHTVKTGGGPTRALVFLPDGGRLLTGSDDGRLRLWDTATGECLRTARAHEGAILSLAVSPDGACVVSTAKDEQAKLTDAARLQPLTTLEGPAGRAVAVAFSPDGTRLACVDKGASVWDARTGRRIAAVQGGPFGAVVFEPDGKGLLASREDVVRIMPATGQSTSVYCSRHGRTHAFALSPGGGRLAAVAGPGHVEFRKFTDRAPVYYYLTGPPPRITTLAFGSTEHRLIAGSEDGTVRVWTLGAPDPIEFWRLDAPVRQAVKNTRRFSLNFEDVPIQDFASLASGLVERTILVHLDALHAHQRFVTAQAQDVTLEEALDQILPPMGLMWAAFDGGVVIATPERMKGVFKPDTWAVGLTEPPATERISFDFVETPIQDVVSFVSGATDRTIVLDARAARGVDVTLRVSDMRLDRALRWIGRSTDLAHTWVDEAILVGTPESLAADWRRIRAVKRLAKLPDKALAEALAKKVSFDVVETPVGDVVTAFLAEQFRLPVAVEDALKGGKGPTVTLRLVEMPLKDALVWICVVTDLSCAWRDGKLMFYHSTPKGHL